MNIITAKPELCHTL